MGLTLILKRRLPERAIAKTDITAKTVIIEDEKHNTYSLTREELMKYYHIKLEGDNG